MLSIGKNHLETILAHAAAEAPNEVCGILAGRDGVVARVYRGINVAANPRVRYELDPQQQLAILREIEDSGQQMLGIYHSHPHSEAYPSRTDLELAFYPDSAYVIVSLAQPDRPVVRAFRMRNGAVEEEELVVDG